MISNGNGDQETVREIVERYAGGDRSAALTLLAIVDTADEKGSASFHDVSVRLRTDYLASVRAEYGHAGPIFAGGRVWLRDEWNVASFHADTLASVWATGPVTVKDARSEADELFAHGRDADSGATP